MNDEYRKAIRDVVEWIERFQAMQEKRKFDNSYDALYSGFTVGLIHGGIIRDFLSESDCADDN